MKLLPFVLNVFCTIPLFAAAPLKYTSAPEFPNNLGKHDFFEKTASDRFAAQARTSSTDCRRHIREVVCLVEPTIDIEEHPEDRECLNGGLQYASYFESLYDHYPPVLQRMFCSLDYIFIERNFLGTAYAGGIVNDKGEEIGSMMGIRQSVLDEKLTLSRWASWKEQLSFGGAKDNYDVNPNLPVIAATTDATVNDFLYFVVAHEFGHLFDFANKVNAVKNCRGDKEDPTCDMAPSSWGAISWTTNKNPRPENTFHMRDSLCFYWCKDNAIEVNNVKKIFSELYEQTDFLSTYATTQPYDDFADSLAYYLFHKLVGGQYVIDTKQHDRYDIMQKLGSIKFQKKFDYLAAFLQRSDLIYP